MAVVTDSMPRRRARLRRTGPPPGQDAGPDRHPDDVGEFGFPVGGRDGVRHGGEASPGFIDEAFRAKEQIRNDVGVDDHLHGRPTPIQASISAAVGRRVCLFHPASIWSSTARRSTTYPSIRSSDFLFHRPVVATGESFEGLDHPGGYIPDGDGGHRALLC